MQERGKSDFFFYKDLSFLPETGAAMEHFKLVFGSGTSDPAKRRPLKNWTSWISWKSSLLGNFHHSRGQHMVGYSNPEIQICKSAKIHPEPP